LRRVWSRALKDAERRALKEMKRVVATGKAVL